MNGGGSDVAVIGAGTVGAACSYYLAAAGLRPVVFEPRPVGTGAASCATGAGFFLAYELKNEAHYRWALAGHALQKALVPVLEEITDSDLQFLCRPSLRIALDDEEEAVVRDSVRLAQPFIPGVRWLSPDEALKIEPRLNPELRGAAYDPECSQIPASGYARALLMAAERLGAVVRTSRVTGLMRSGERVVGVKDESGEHAFGAVVLAMGPWTRTANDWLGVDLPVRVLKGERLMLRFPGKPLEVLLWSPRRGHVISRLDGFLSIGSTAGRDIDDRARNVLEGTDDAAFEVLPTDAARVELLSKAAELLPAVHDATVAEHVAGIRPYSPDSLPLIGPVPDAPGAFIAAGHTHRGISLAAITGKVIADLVSSGGTELPIPLAAMSPSRFPAPADA